MACVDLAQIVAKQSWIGRSSALGSTTIYTPAADGLYRVSAYLEVASGTPSVTANIGYTDDHHTPSSTYYSLGTFSSGEYNNGGTFQAYTFRAKSGDAISVSTTYGSTGSFDFYVVLELLW